MTTYSDLIIWQYQKLKNIALVDGITDEFKAAFDDFMSLGDQLDINKAQKYSLDIIAAIVGTSRNSDAFFPIEFFGWSHDIYAKGFGEGEWYRAGEPSKTSLKLGDEDLRFLIKAINKKNNQRTDIESLTTSMVNLFGEDADVIDHYDMTMTVKIPENKLNSFAKVAINTLDILPRPMCVKYIIEYI